MNELHALKQQLVGLTPDDLAAEQAQALREEISAIRLQLKRLESDRAETAELVNRLTNG